MIYLIIYIVDHSTEADGNGLELVQALHASSGFYSWYQTLTCKGYLHLVQTSLWNMRQQKRAFKPGYDLGGLDICRVSKEVSLVLHVPAAPRI